MALTKRCPDVWSKDPYAEEQLCSCARRYFGTPREITIFLTTDLKSPALRAIVQPYKSNDDSDEAKKADFPRDHVPSHEALQRWVEGQIKREYKSDFPRALQSFLLAYSEGGRSLPKVCLQTLRPNPTLYYADTGRSTTLLTMFIR